MSVIDVPSELIKPLQQLAAERGESVNAIVEQLIADYLCDQRHHYLIAEMEQFRLRHKLPLFLDGPEATLVIPDDKNVSRLRRD